MMQAKMQPELLSTARHNGGLRVRTGVRGGICVDVDAQVKSALQTLTTALGGTTTTTAAPTVTTGAASTTS